MVVYKFYNSVGMAHILPDLLINPDFAIDQCGENTYSLCRIMPVFSVHWC